MIELGIEFRSYLAQFENGQMIELATFSAVAVVGSIMLYFLFSNRTKSPAKNIKVQSSPGLFDVQNLVIKFSEGFMEGLESHSPSQKPESPVINADF